MKEVSFNFSLTDFLAYLFPGTVTLVAIAGFLSLTPFKELLFTIKTDIFTGIILIALAYSIGVIISSLTINYESKFYEFILKLKRKKNDSSNESAASLSRPQPEIFETEIINAFNNTFKIKINNGEPGDKTSGQDVAAKWTSDHFFAARSLVREKIPTCSMAIERQSSLRQMRRNSIIPVLLLGITGIIAAVQGLFFDDENKAQNKQFLYWLLLFIAVFGTPWTIYSLIKRMMRNRERETREVCTGLLAFDCSRTEEKDTAQKN